MNTDEQVRKELTLIDQELHERMGWFIAMRWLGGLGLVLTIIMARFVFLIGLPYRQLVWTVFAIFLYNALCTFIAAIIRQGRTVTHTIVTAFLNGQIVVDLMAIILLLYYSGGVVNFFIVFMMFHVAMGSVLLSRVQAFLHAGLAALLVNGLAWLEFKGVILHHHPVGLLPVGIEKDYPLVFCIVSVMSAAFFITVYLVGTVAKDLKRKETELAHANRQLRALQTARTFYLRRTSHELRSPLSVARTCLRTVLKGYAGGVTPKQRDLIVRADRRIGNLLEVVDDVLEYSRLRSLRVLETRAPVDMGLTCLKTVESLRPLADAKNIQLSVHVPSESVIVTGDPESFDRLFLNLVGNAVKYARPNGSVTAIVRRTKTRVLIEVADDGIGIPAADRDKVFDEFHRARNARSQEPGSGMGLAIVKRIVEMHSGSIELESEVGQGTRFTVAFPAGDE